MTPFLVPFIKRKGDYLLPDLYLEKDENYERFGRYGILRLQYQDSIAFQLNYHTFLYPLF